VKVLTTLVLLFLCGCGSLYESSQEEVPLPPREFRAAWIATVENIDWPSRPGLSKEKQQAELIALLDHAVAVGLNTVVFQVRPACDAFYASEIEPWSRFLSGRSDEDPGYDPLAFAVAEAHSRGLELHAWFNPYRALPSDKEPPVSARHVAHADSPLRGAVRRYGKLSLLDPGLPEVRAHTQGVILDVVRRYDVDAVHMDDYFYPYPLELSDGTKQPFPDDASFAKYGGGLSRSDWRRRNVDTFVAELGPAVHEVEPWVKVGIAPFGIWRPRHPPAVRGFDAYEFLAADTRGWLRKGWVDYLSPQLYWGIDFPEQPFTDLLAWWEAQNTSQRHVWPGMSTRWIESKRDPTRGASEILNQIKLARTLPRTPGHCHWNLGALVEDRGGIVKALQEGPYRERALIPASPWLGDAAPAALEDVEVEARGEEVLVTWVAPKEARWVTLQTRREEGAWQLVGMRRASTATWELVDSPDALCLRALSATGVLGPPAVLRRSE
jgi:uncharacterized lipoprotein YddW (UPF0748 family)